MRFGMLLLAGGALLAAEPASASAVIGGAPDPYSQNCLPFGCINPGDRVQYQQVYNGAYFGTGQTINGVSFATGPQSGATATADYVLSLYYTSKAVNGLSSDLQSNKGAYIGTFQPLLQYGVFASGIRFSGGAFAYDPALGNLLVEVLASGVTASGTAGFLSGFNGDTSCAYLVSNSLRGTDPIGLITTFDFANSGVPEPATWGMMILGMGAVGFAMRRRKNVSMNVRFA